MDGPLEIVMGGSRGRYVLDLVRIHQVIWVPLAHIQSHHGIKTQDLD